MERSGKPRSGPEPFGRTMRPVIILANSRLFTRQGKCVSSEADITGA
jgi:hypothetical protein